MVAKLLTGDQFLRRRAGDRSDVPIDFHLLVLLLKTAHDTEVGLGDFAHGVWVGPGARMPRLPALQKPKKKWRLASQADPWNDLKEEAGVGPTWRRNCPSVAELSEKVVAVLEDQDQTNRGPLVKVSESDARSRYQNMVVASLDATRKDKATGEVTARVLMDGTDGYSANTRTPKRDPERSSMASDLKRATKEEPDRAHVLPSRRI